jgi:hypothetical protein
LVDRTELVVPVLVVTDPDDFLAGEARFTVETDVVDSVVVASVSTEAGAASVAVEEAIAVSAADRPERPQPAASRPVANAAASDSLVIDRIPE